MSAPEFYIGYLHQAPRAIARVMRATSIALLVIAVIVALILVVAQEPFADSHFEWERYREFAGVIRTSPAPMLIGLEPYLLVGGGKHGVDITGLDGRRVRLRGALITRGKQRAIEVLPEAIALGPVAGPGKAAIVLGQTELTGEIVDSKCHLGVMNPGSGKVHRDCAVRCLSGGIPPGFRVRDRDGREHMLLLARQTGRPLVPGILSRVAEPVRLQGTLESMDGALIFRIQD